MSAHSNPRIYTYIADGAIAKGKAVKIGSDRNHVVVVSATTDKSVGIAQNAASAAGDLVEVALPGGGAKALAKAAIAAGDILGHNADGALQKAAAANDRTLAIAMEDAAAGDVFSVEVVIGMATQAQS